MTKRTMKAIYIAYQVIHITLLFILYVVCFDKFGLTRNYYYPLITLPPTIMYFVVSSVARKYLNDKKK
jgi:hypothetical protein